MTVWDEIARTAPPTAAGDGGAGGEAVLARLERHALEETRRQRRLSIALAVAVAAHLVAFLVRLPAPERVHEAPAARVVAKLYPTPKLVQKPVVLPKPEPKKKPVPVPDPTPAEPEPVVREPAPQPTPVVPEYARVTGDVVPPKKLHAPHPPYPEVARRVRREGTVTLELLVERDGTISSVRATSEVGFGLEESALRTVSKWKLEPAMLHGEPVPVLYVLNVRFELDLDRTG